MTNEWNHCRKDFCFAHRLIETGFVALWPQEFQGSNDAKVERFRWRLFVRWSDEWGTKVVRDFCLKHHNLVMDMFSKEAEDALREQEATDEWLARTNSRMWTA